MSWYLCTSGIVSPQVVNPPWLFHSDRLELPLAGIVTAKMDCTWDVLAGIKESHPCSGLIGHPKRKIVLGVILQILTLPSILWCLSGLPSFLLGNDFWDYIPINKRSTCVVLWHDYSAFFSNGSCLALRLSAWKPGEPIIISNDCSFPVWKALDNDPSPRFSSSQQPALIICTCSESALRHDPWSIPSKIQLLLLKRCLQAR